MMFDPRTALAVPVCLLVCISASATTKTPPDADVRTYVVDTLDVTADRPDPYDAIRELSTFATVHEIGDARGGGVSIADVLEEGAEAVEVVRKLCGVTNAREALPGTIRGDLAMSIQSNLVHGLRF